MNEQEYEDIVEEMIQSGFIDYDEDGDAVLYYKNYLIWTVFDETVVFVEKGRKNLEFVESRKLIDKIESMFKAWEAV